MNARYAAAALAFLACACSTSTGPKPAELTPLEHEAQVRVLWSANAGDGDRFIFAPALADGALYTAARDGTVTRFEAASGRTVCSRTRRHCTYPGLCGRALTCVPARGTAWHGSSIWRPPSWTSLAAPRRPNSKDVRSSMRSRLAKRPLRRLISKRWMPTSRETGRR